MNTTKISARVYDTGKRVTVSPTVVLGYDGDCSILRFADGNGCAMRLANDG